jgi:hypothetical protein
LKAGWTPFFTCFDQLLPRTPRENAFALKDNPHNAHCLRHLFEAPIIKPAAYRLQNPFSAPFSMCNMNGMTRNCKRRFM